MKKLPIATAVWHATVFIGLVLDSDLKNYRYQEKTNKKGNIVRSLLKKKAK